MSDELAVWQPSEFETGTDLLPMSNFDLSTKLAEGEELVGEENIEEQDIVLPVLSLLHGTSDAVTRGVEGAKPGVFHLSVLDEVIQPPLRLLVVHYSKSKAMFPKDNDERYQQPHPQHPDAGPMQRCVARNGVIGDQYGDCEKCGLYKWRSQEPGERPPLCAESHNFVVWLPSGPAIMRCSRSNYGTGKRFVSDKKMAGVNWWHHPLVVRVGRGTKVLAAGKVQEYPTMELHWAKRDTVPVDVRNRCKTVYEEIAAAHELGRVRGDTEEDDDPSVPF